MSHKPGKAASVLFNSMLIICVPLTIFLCVVFFVAYNHEVSQISGLEWFTPIEDFFSDAETPLPVMITTGIAVLFYLATYVISFMPPYKKRPIRRIIFLHLLAAGVLASYAYFIVKLIELLVAILVLYPLAAWGIERLTGLGMSRLATWLIDREQYGHANAVLAVALRFQPGDHRLQRGLGLARYDAGDVVGAIDVLEPLADGAPDDERIHHILEECYHTERAWDKALKYGKRLLDLHPPDDVLRMRVASVLERMNRHDEAVALVKKAPTSENMELIEFLVGLHVEAGDVAQASEALRQLENIETGTQPRSLNVHQQLAERFPDDIHVLEGMANFMIRHRKREEGFGLIEKIVQKSPQRHDLRTRLVRKYQEDGQLDKAEPHLVALMDAGRDSVDIALLYGDILIQREEYDKALMHFQYAVENYHDDYRFPYFLAQINFRTQALEDAMRWCEEALRRVREDEGRSRVRNLRSRVEEAIVARDLQVLQDRCRRDPANVEMRVQLIQTMVRHRMADQAVGEYEILLENHPELRPTVMRQLEEFTAKPDSAFRLIDYLFDLKIQDRRWSEAIELAQRMAARSLHGDELLEEHCHTIFTHAPQHVDTLRVFVDLMYRRKNWSKMIDLAQHLETAGVTPDEAQLRRLFEAATQLRDYSRAAAIGEKLILRDPDEIDMRLRVTDLYVQAGEFDRALGHLRNAQARDYHNAEVVQRMQDLAKKRRDHRLRKLLEHLQNDAGDAQAHIDAGDIFLEMNQPKKAVTHYQAVPMNSPLKNLSRGKLAHALAQLGMFDLANETLEETNIEVSDPDDALRLKTQVYEIADLLEKEGETDRALGLFKKIFRVDASYRDVVDRIERLNA